MSNSLAAVALGALATISSLSVFGAVTTPVAPVMPATPGPATKAADQGGLRGATPTVSPSPQILVELPTVTAGDEYVFRFVMTALGNDVDRIHVIGPMAGTGSDTVELLPYVTYSVHLDYSTAEDVAPTARLFEGLTEVISNFGSVKSYITTETELRVSNDVDFDEAAMLQINRAGLDGIKWLTTIYLQGS